jgi:hypothetical protein
MRSFRLFFEQDTSEEEKDIQQTLEKIPAHHRNLVQGFRWRFHIGNTLNGDDEHVGYMDDNTKEIAIAAPWFYSREFTILHEIAHRVWEKFVNQDLRNQWAQIVNNTPNRQKQEPEELFCHGYGAAYAKHPPLTHYHKEWIEFIKNLP